jgi:hypothetical protein
MSAPWARDGEPDLACALALVGRETFGRRLTINWGTAPFQPPMQSVRSLIRPRRNCVHGRGRWNRALYCSPRCRHTGRRMIAGWPQPGLPAAAQGAYRAVPWANRSPPCCHGRVVLSRCLLPPLLDCPGGHRHPSGTLPAQRAMQRVGSDARDQTATCCPVCLPPGRRTLGPCAAQTPRPGICSGQRLAFSTAS